MPDLENERIFFRCNLGRTFGDEPNLKKRDLESYFEKYKKDPKKLSHESIIGDKSSRNHLAMITRSEWCLIKNLKNINIHKFRWIKGRINEFLMPHSQLGIDYDFIEHPKGYSKIKKLKDDLYKNKFFKKTKQILVLIFMLSIYTIFIFKIFSSKEKINIRFFYLSLFLIYSYIMLISSLFGNQEGQRFMHYAIIIQFLFFINLFNINKKFKN